MFEIGQALDVGLKRRGKVNQDALSVLLPGLLNHRSPLLVLSDGMGGYNGGEIASRLTVKAMLGVYRRVRLKKADYQTLLAKGVQQAHHAITRRSRRSSNLEAMGCTVVAAVLTPEEIHLVNVGDSRAYLVRPGAMEQISYDHSKVAEFVRAGLINEKEAQVHPKRNELTLSLTGRREEVEPYLASVHWAPGDALLLCSDGLWGPVTEAQIEAVIREMPPQQAAEKLVELANVGGGPDNISVLLARHAGVHPAADDRDGDDTNPGL